MGFFGGRGDVTPSPENCSGEGVLFMATNVVPFLWWGFGAWICVVCGSVDEVRRPFLRGRRTAERPCDS